MKTTPFCLRGTIPYQQPKPQNALSISQICAKPAPHALKNLNISFPPVCISPVGIILLYSIWGEHFNAKILALWEGLSGGYFLKDKTGAFAPVLFYLFARMYSTASSSVPCGYVETSSLSGFSMNSFARNVLTPSFSTTMSSGTLLPTISS